jgi:hypothetical protein
MVYERRFYTYAYLRKDGTPYYIGKGQGDRAFKKGKKEIKPPKDKSRVIFLKQGLTEEEAFRHEKYMIAVFGRKDLGTGILRNLTNGGDGAAGAIRSEEAKEKNRQSGIEIGRLNVENQRGWFDPKNHETTIAGRRKGGKTLVEQQRGMFDPKNKIRMEEARQRGSESSAEKKRKAVICVETGVMYCCAREASEQTGVNPSHVRAVARGVRRTAGGFRWAFVGR